MRQSPYGRIFLFLFFTGLVFCKNICAETLWQGIPEKKIALKANLAADKLNSMRFVFSDAKTRMEISLNHKVEFGKTKYSVKYGFQIDSARGLEQIFNKLPQFPGEYDLTISGKGASTSIILEHLAAIEPISFGEDLGELLIENAGNSVIEAHSEQLSISNPAFRDSMRKGVSTPDGGMLFRLPAGYWSLERKCNPVEMVQLIPVHSGKRTTISWAVIPRINLESEAGTSVNRLEIREVKAEPDGTATLRFAMPPACRGRHRLLKL
jgi:hypothetical protein